jgi:hypothetical protein
VGLVLSVFQTLVDMRILIFFLFCRNLGFFRKQDGGTLLARRLPWNAFVKHVVSFILPGMSVCFEDDWYRMSFRTHVNGSVQASPPVLSAPLLRYSMRHPSFFDSPSAWTERLNYKQFMLLTLFPHAACASRTASMASQ